MLKNKIEFSVEKDGVKTSFYVKKPNVEQNKVLNNTYNTAYHDALKSKALLRTKIVDFAKAQDIWSDEKEQKLKDLNKTVQNGLFRLAQGGKGGFTKQAAIDLALEIRKTRNEISALTGPLDNITANSAESQAENARFNQMMILCTYYGEGDNEDKQYFKDLEDMDEKLRNEDAVSSEAFKHMVLLSFGIEKDARAKWPENKFLIENKYLDAECRRINTDGHLIDEQGNLVDSKGRRVNGDGKLIDEFGHVIDEKGNYMVEDFVPFVE